MFGEKDYRFVVFGTDFGIGVYNRLKMWYFMFDFKMIAVLDRIVSSNGKRFSRRSVFGRIEPEKWSFHMKRILSLLLCLAMFLTVSGLVLAQGDESSVPDASDSSKPSDSFEFEVVRSSQSGNTLTIQWNQSEAEGAMVTAVRIDGTDITVTISPTDPDTFTVSLNSLKTGVYDAVRFTLLKGTKQEYVEKELRVIKGGDLNLKFDPLTRNASGKVVATLKDEHGRPVSGYTVKMEVGNVSETQTTNAKGQVTSNTPIDDTDAAKKTVLVIAENSTATENGITIRYLGTQKGFFDGFTVPTDPTTQPPTVAPTTDGTTAPTTTVPSPVITTGTKDSSTSTTSGDSSTAVTYPTILGAGTTAAVDNKIAVNLSLDSGILNLFGLSQTDFATKGRLLMTPEAYQSLAGGSGAVMLSVRSSSELISETLVQGAVSGNSEFSKYPSSSRSVAAFDLSMIAQVDGQYVALTTISGSSMYEVQLPVPNSMKNAEKVAITIFDGSALVKPEEVEVKNGVVTFETNTMGTFVLLGFAGSGGQSSPVSVLVIVLLIVGVLLLVGAGLLLYFFVIRKPKEDEELEELPEEESAGDDPEEFVRLDDELQEYDPNSRDIYSGRDDISRRNPPKPYDQDRDR